MTHSHTGSAARPRQRHQGVSGIQFCVASRFGDAPNLLRCDFSSCVRQQTELENFRPYFNFRHAVEYVGVWAMSTAVQHFPNDHEFEPEQLHAMGEAYDLACLALPNV